MKNFFTCLILVIVISGCYDDKNIIESSEVFTEPPRIFINTKLEGNVNDSENEPLSDYSLVINGSTHDNSTSNYSLNLKKVDKRSETIRIYKEEKPIGIRTFPLVENDINYRDINCHESPQLMELKPKMSFSNININTENSDWIYKDRSNVQVEFANINPNVNITEVGYTREYKTLALSNHGGFYINFRDVNGNEIKPEKNDSYNISINNLDDDFGLFYYDKGIGRWFLIKHMINDDTISLNSTGYFCISQYDKGSLIQSNIQIDGYRLKNHSVIFDYNPSISKKLIISEKSNVITYVPSKSDIEVKLINSCNSEFLGKITLISNEDDILKTDLNFSNIDGFQYLGLKLISCKTGDFEYISLKDNDMEVPYYINSDLGDIAIPKCKIDQIDQFRLYEKSTDSYASYSVSKMINYTFLICKEDLDGYLHLSIDEDEKLYRSLEISNQSGKAIISTKNNEVEIIIPDIAIGSTANSDVNISIDDQSFGQSGYYISCRTSELGCGIEEFETGELNWKNKDYFIIKFNGESWIQTLNPPKADYRNISGTIMIKK